MARIRKNILVSDDAINRGLVFDSKNNFLREKVEEKIDYQLAVLTVQFHKNENKTKTIDKDKVVDVVSNFMKDIYGDRKNPLIRPGILPGLEDAKKKSSTRRISEN